MDCSGAFKNWHSESCSGCQRCQSVNFCFTLQCVSFRPVPIKSTLNSERIQMDKVAGWGGKRLQGLVSRRYLSVRLIRKTICTNEISKRRSGHFVSKNASGGQSIEEVAQQRLERYRICLLALLWEQWSRCPNVLRYIEYDRVWVSNWFECSFKIKIVLYETQMVQDDTGCS